MAKDCSFDIVSEYNKQELVNAIDQVKRELTSRFDLKNSNSQVELEADKTVTITTSDDMKLRNIIDILQSKLVKRNLSIKILDPKPVENALGGFLLNQRLALYTNPYTSTEVNLYCDKNSDTYITFGVYGLTAVPAETTQAFRIEATFLLSESLI